MIPDEAVEAAVHAYMQYPRTRGLDNTENMFRAALEAAAPHMLADLEQELSDAKRVIALLVLDAGGKVAVSRRAVTELPNDPVIETRQDVINGGWVIRATT